MSLEMRTLFRVVRFGIAGTAAVTTNLGVLWLLLNVAGLQYLVASIIAFLSGFVTSFTLQKFWTFQDRTVDRIGRQILVYLGIVLFNLGLNTLVVYLFVEYVGLLPLIAQAVAALLIAAEGFFAYRYLVFQQSNVTPSLRQETKVSS